MKTQIKRFLLTLGFMTRIPVNVDLGEVKDEDMHKGFLYYPVVGLILGLCDMAARTRERMLEIMKDSRIGTNGAVAMCFDLALKFAGIYYSDIRWLMILLMPIAGKMVQGAIVYKAIYPREKGIGIYVGTVSLGTVIGTVILGLIAMVLAFSCWGVLIFAILFGFAYLFRVYITGKIGGITGDVMGAGNELAEVLLLLVVIVLTKYTGMTPLSLFPF